MSILRNFYPIRTQYIDATFGKMYINKLNSSTVFKVKMPIVP